MASRLRMSAPKWITGRLRDAPASFRRLQHRTHMSPTDNAQASRSAALLLFAPDHETFAAAAVAGFVLFSRRTHRRFDGHIRSFTEPRVRARRSGDEDHQPRDPRRWFRADPG